jgi:voltage-gated potassium channel
MYNLEPAREIQGGFTSYWDAVWWTGMLLTSIGSQYWPQTTEGRVLGFLLALYGLGILGYITATLASFFIGRDALSNEGEVASSDEIRQLRRDIATLRDAIGAADESRRPAPRAAASRR